MAFWKQRSELVSERRGISGRVRKLIARSANSLQSLRRGRRFRQIFKGRILFWMFSVAVLISVYLAVYRFNMHFEVKNENGILPMRDETELKSSVHDSSKDVRVPEGLIGDAVMEEPKKKARRQKFIPCEVNFTDSVNYFVEPEEALNTTRFSLRYVEGEEGNSHGGSFQPRFGGHQTFEDRERSFYAKNQTIHCGFVENSFKVNEKDKSYMRNCIIVVSSCIFGSSDFLRRPASKLISDYSKKNTCFAMFVDEQTLATLSAEGNAPDDNGNIGLWKIIVIRNLPYEDLRKTGKVPKFLSHRLFPSSRYSIWLDSKLRLVVDPMLLIEYLLWRRGSEYAISNHYTRHCVWDEVIQNKRLNKYNHSAIDEQFNFYKSDGLTKYNPLDPDNVLPSYVPEGSFIVRAHTPMSNLFSCLWFNEVDRFTSRDQLSFAYTYLKLKRTNPGNPFQLYMFKDCERRSLVKLFHHRVISP